MIFLIITPFESPPPEWPFQQGRVKTQFCVLYPLKILYIRSEMELDPQLVDPICEGSIVQVDFQHLADLLKTPLFAQNMLSISDRTLHSLHKSSNVLCQVSDS